MDTKDSKEMNVKIQNASPFGGGDNKGSSAGLVTYLQHEDAERVEAGKEPMPFFTVDGIEVSAAEVISKIDRNHSHLGKNDDKFYHIVISPSKDEVLAMGGTEQELFNSAITLAGAISDQYAAGFNRENIQDADDIVIYWKPHFTRGDDDELQFHIHGVVARNSKSVNGRSHKLSPMTAHRNTENGPVKGGFDRSAFFTRCEKLFDKLFKFERQVAETYAYRNAQKHGTPEQKGEQAILLAAEKKKAVKDAVTAGLGNRRETVRSHNDIQEVAALLEQEGFNFQETKAPEMDPQKRMALANDLMHIFEISRDKCALDLNLASAGIMCSSDMAESGGVADLTFLLNGMAIHAQELLDKSCREKMLDKWEKMTGQPSAEKVRMQKEEQRMLEESALDPSQFKHVLKIGHHM